MPHLLIPKIGVPNLIVPTVGGKTFSISEARPKNFQIVVFYRGLHCPKCKTQLQEIEENFDALKAQGLDVIAISMDNKARAEKTQKDWEIKHLPIGYDLSLETARMYGLFISDQRPDSKEPKIFSEPGLFVIKPDGTLYAEYIQNTPFGRPPIMDIAGGLDFVVKKGYPVRGTSTAKS
ncbi:AhpC/TSA family protein [Hellea sp.]|nr:AhpC/TSA family protein [Hellea sp.]